MPRSDLINGKSNGRSIFARIRVRYLPTIDDLRKLPRALEQHRARHQSPAAAAACILLTIWTDAGNRRPVCRRRAALGVLGAYRWAAGR
jgi:hypothetical protein